MIDDFNYLISAPNQIMSISTFSWWGAFFSGSDCPPGYIDRVRDKYPFQRGDRHPWLDNNDYEEDKRVLSGPIEDGVMKFTT